jgi:dihydrodipicolinate synthase/N-acetylneuraminate lyase
MLTSRTQLADASPIPVLIYNFPGVSSGLDVNSEMLEKLGHHPNIVGVKLTCGGIAKVARVRSRFAPETFCALAGQSDWLLPAVSVGGTGTITGLANIYPRVSPPEHHPFYSTYISNSVKFPGMSRIIRSFH